MRVIYVLDRLLAYANDPEGKMATARFDDPASPGQPVGIYWGEQAHFTFEAILNRGIEGVTFEVWQPDLRASRRYDYTFPCGVVQRMFPARKAGRSHGEHRVESAQLINELKATDPATTLVLTGRLTRPLSRAVHAALTLHKKLIQIRGVPGPPRSLLPGAPWHRRPLRRLQLLQAERAWHRLMPQAAGVLYQTVDTPAAFAPYFKGPMYRLETGIEAPFSAATPAEKGAIRARMGLPPEAPVLFSSSRLGPHKQLAELVAAFQQADVPGSHLVISGHGAPAYVEACKAQGPQLVAQGRLHFPGFLSGEALWDAYRAADAFVNSSLSEGGPVSAKKALAVGLPVASTPSGTVYEFLQDHHALIELPTHAHGEWPALLSALLAPTAPRVPLRAVYDAFSWDAIAQQTMDVYTTTMAWPRQPLRPLQTPPEA